MTSARCTRRQARTCAAVSRATVARGWRRALTASSSAVASPFTFAPGKLHAIAVAQRTRARGNHLIAFAQTADDFDELLTFGADLHGAEDGDPVQVLKHPAPTAEVGDRVHRHDERFLLGVCGDADACVHARLQSEIAVGNLDLDGGRASRWIEYRCDTSDAAPEHLSRERIHFDLGRSTGAQFFEVALDGIDDETHFADVHDVHDRCVLRDECARVNRSAGDEAVDRRDNDGVREVDTQLVEAGLRLRALSFGEIDLRNRGLIARLVVVECLLGQQLPLKEIA